MGKGKNFYPKAAESGGMAGFCLKVHPLQKTQPPYVRLVEGYTYTVPSSPEKIQSFGNPRWPLHDYPGSLPCFRLHSGFSLCQPQSKWPAHLGQQWVLEWGSPFPQFIQSTPVGQARCSNFRTLWEGLSPNPTNPISSRARLTGIHRLLRE